MSIGNADFEELQQKLTPLWNTISRFNDLEQTIVVVPSLSIPKEFLEKLGPQVIIYEERMLFLLLLLRQPRARVVYVTSVPVDQRVIDYYLSLLPGVIPSHAKKRLFPVSVDDSSLDPLSQKILSNDQVLDRLRDLIIDPDRAHIVPYITTEIERDLALELGIPIYGCDPSLAWLGTKSGAREVFETEGIPHPRGVGNLRTVDELVDALATMKGL
ncbi:MAG: peptide ligase PGM1-related protein, partial [Acidimicrobiia bacterium]